MNKELEEKLKKEEALIQSEIYGVLKGAAASLQRQGLRGQLEQLHQQEILKTQLKGPYSQSKVKGN